MNDIAKLTQELEYVRSISNPSHLKPYSKKRGLFQSYYISWVMKKYAMISTLDEASIKKILPLASLGFYLKKKIDVLFLLSTLMKYKPLFSFFADLA